MLKISKIKPEDLKTLTFNEYKKVVRLLFNGLKKSHKGPDQPVEFVVLTNFEFADKKGKKTMIILPGKQTPEWKKEIKTRLKENKKNVLVGHCFVSETDGQEEINVMPKQGMAKVAQIQKMGKQMFNMAKLGFKLAAGAAEASNAASASVDLTAIEEQQSAKEQTKENTQLSKKEALKEELKALVDSSKEIKSDFDKVKELAARLKKGQSQQTDLNFTKDVIEKVNLFVNAFHNSKKPIQERLQKHKNKIVDQLPKLEKLAERLASQSSGANAAEGTATGAEEGAAAATANLSLEELQTGMESAKKAVDQLQKELDLDAILAKL